MLPNSLTDSLYRNQLSIGYNFASSVESGVVTTVLTAPIWVVKTRMQLQQKLLVYQTLWLLDLSARLQKSSSTPDFWVFLCSQTSLSPLLDCVYTIVRKEGFHALFTGLVPSLFLVSHGIIQVYYQTRKWLWLVHCLWGVQVLWEIHGHRGCERMGLLSDAIQ